jgi:hypothetical protein
MLAADEYPPVGVGRRRSRRRSPRSRFARSLRHGWRRTKLRKVIYTVLVTVAAVMGGYKVSMYVIDRSPSVDEIQSIGK